MGEARHLPSAMRLLLGAPSRRAVLTIAAAVGLCALVLPGGRAPQALSNGCTDDWPMYQHDPSHHAASGCTAISPSTVASLHAAWFVPTAQPVTASPTVSGGQVYVGDNGGAFSDIDAATGTVRWTFTVTPGAPDGCGTTDRHQPSYGEITGSAAVGQVPGFADGHPTVYVGAGGSLFALDAQTGACRWATDLDPSNPTSPIEVESSPVLFLSGRQPEVIVGSDSNESPEQAAPGGVQALDATTGALLWKFEPENNQTATTLAAPTTTKADGTPDTANLGDGCGDVWSSPALEAAAPAGLHSAHGSAVPAVDGLVVTTTGNCPQGRAEEPAVVQQPKAQCANQVPAPVLEGMAALDATTGCLVWRWSEPVNQYSNPAYADGGDTDIGSSPVLTSITTPNGPTPAVIDGSKSGYMYALDERSGSQLWASQPAQPGQTGAALAGAIGGFIGSSALGAAGATPAIFGATAIPAPFAGAGVQPGGPAGLPEATPDTSLAGDPQRAASLHAVSTSSGAVLWQALVSLPSYGAVTYADGVVFAPSTTGFSIVAYDAATGVPLWAFPTGGSMSSGATMAGGAVFVGSGTDQAPGVPPQVTGVWSFVLAAGGSPALPPTGGSPTTGGTVGGLVP